MAAFSGYGLAVRSPQVRAFEGDRRPLWDEVEKRYEKFTRCRISGRRSRRANLQAEMQNSPSSSRVQEESRIRPPRCLCSSFEARYGNEGRVPCRRERRHGSHGGRRARRLPKKSPQVKLIVSPCDWEGRCHHAGIRNGGGDWSLRGCRQRTFAEAFTTFVGHIGDAAAIMPPGTSRREGQSAPAAEPSDCVPCFQQAGPALFGLPISDTQCGAKLLRGDAMRAASPVPRPHRWAFDVDLLFNSASGLPDHRGADDVDEPGGSS